MSQDFLLELGCEDLPARYVLPLANALKDGVTGGLSKRGVQIGTAKLFATPRRIAVLVESVADKQADQKIERHGPALAAAMKDGQPTPAALGFAKSCGVEFSAVGQKDGKLYFAKSEPGRNTADLIAEIFEETLKSMDTLVPKRMRWGLGGLEAAAGRLPPERRATDGAAGGSSARLNNAMDGKAEAYRGDETFVRPVQWITCLLGPQVVALQRFGLKAGNETFGHRFHAPKAIALQSPADYEPKLKAAQVWADFETRKLEIKKQIEAEAKKLKGTARITDDLLTEVAAIVEWPTAIHGRMEERFMALPPEVIIATIETNQRYFPVFGADDKLLPVFITVSNIESKDFTQVVTGNERVVRPRLTDALFFWEQDAKHSLESYGKKLASITFQAGLGSIERKVVRVSNLVGSACVALPSLNAATLLRATELCKNDLTTRMVYEFPELQGVMGGYYAKKSGESREVALAIRDHYLPTQQGTRIPETPEGQVLSLLDKLDTLAGIFSIGQKPTSSKDPFALRRAALGVLRILIEGRLALDLRELLVTAISQVRIKAGDKETLSALFEFVMERLRAYYSDQKLPTEMFEAVKSLGISKPLDFDARIKALQSFWALPAAKNLAAAHKRVRNILKQSGDASAGSVDASLFDHPAEKTLAEKMSALPKTGDYASKLKNLAGLREPVDAFFEGVMVNAEDAKVRNNRLALLRQLDVLCREVADISLLPG